MKSRKALRNLILKVASIADECGGYVFGGCVRDTLINGEECNDIDVKFKHISAIEPFLRSMEREFPGLFISFNTKTNIRFLVVKYFFNFTEEGFYLPFDIVIQSRYAPLDSIVNGFICDGNSIQHVSGNRKIEDLAIKLCREKIMPMTRTRLRLPRLKRFKARGWQVYILDE